MAEWADVAGCYRWLHDKSEKIFAGSNMWITIPVIILSTLTGTANFAVGSFIPEDSPDLKKYVGAGIGAISIFAGILTTLGNFFQFAQKSEAHKVAGIAWGKFQRQIAVEFSLHPNDRLDSMDFIKICRAELDRLIEQSPAIPDSIIDQFTKEFKNLPQLKRPDIAHGIEHTEAFKASNERMKVLAGEASLFLMHKKKLLKDEIIPDIDNRLTKIIDTKITALKEEINVQASSNPTRGSSIAIPIPLGTAGGTLPRTGSAFDPDWRKLISASKKENPPGGLEIRIPATKQGKSTKQPEEEPVMKDNPLYKKGGKKDSFYDISAAIVEVTEK